AKHTAGPAAGEHAGGSRQLDLGAGLRRCSLRAAGRGLAVGGRRCQVGFVLERTDLHLGLHAMNMRTAVMMWVSDGLRPTLAILSFRQCRPCESGGMRSFVTLTTPPPLAARRW